MRAGGDDDRARVTFERHNRFPKYRISDPFECHAVAERRRNALQARQARRRRVGDLLRRGDLAGAAIQFLVRKVERREGAAQLPGLTCELARALLEFARQVGDPLRIFGNGVRAATIIPSGLHRCHSGLVEARRHQ